MTQNEKTNAFLLTANLYPTASNALLFLFIYATSRSPHNIFIIFIIYVYLLQITTTVMTLQIKAQEKGLRSS